MNSIIVYAIGQTRSLELRYHGYSRIVEPYAYGRDKGGDEILRCYQTNGGSVTGERVGWKLLKMRDVFSLDLQKEMFSPRSKYRKGDKAMEYFYAQL